MRNFVYIYIYIYIYLHYCMKWGHNLLLVLLLNDKKIEKKTLKYSKVKISILLVEVFNWDKQIDLLDFETFFVIWYIYRRVWIKYVDISKLNLAKWASLIQ